MDILTVTLRTVTPLFLGGSDPKEQAELRIPPIKSAIRYWYRAWLGRYFDLARMREQEAQHLGLTGGQSSVLIQFDSYGRIHAPQSSQQLPFVGRPAKRRSVNAGEEFTLRFISRSALDWLKVPLAIWLHCGGLGGRARRGGGVLDDSKILFPDLNEADASWQRQLETGTRPLTSPSDWPILSKATASILEFKTANVVGAMEALKATEMVYKTYRASLSADRNYLGSAEDRRGSPRAASPIHFRPFKRDGAWWVRITVFKSRWGEKPYDERKQIQVLNGLISAFISKGAKKVPLP